MKGKIILGIETTTNICSVALWDGEKMWQEVTETARSHSKTLLPMIEMVLKKAGLLTISNVDAIACTQGPGSFTGVRIGIGVAKGLAFGQDIPIIPISPLQAIAYRCMKLASTDSGASRVTALMDARMGELYAADYYRDTIDSIVVPILHGKEKLTNISAIDIGGQVFAGTGMQEYQQDLINKNAKLSEVIFPYAEDVVELAKILPILPVSAADFTPIYLRDKVVD